MSEERDQVTASPWHDGHNGETLIRVGPPSGTPALPHWTEPERPTPVAPAGDDVAGSAPLAPGPATAAPQEADAPATVARWRAKDDDWTDGDASFEDLAAAHDDAVDLGALDERERMLDEQYLTFEDLEVPRAELRTIAPRGSAQDPIRTQAVRDLPARAPARPRAGHAGEEEDDTVPNPGEVPSAAPAGGTGGRDRAQAIKVGIGIASAALAVFLIGAFTPLRWLPVVVVVGIVAGAVTELYGAAERAGFNPLKLLGVLFTATMPVVAYLAGSSAFPAGEGTVLVLFVALTACMAWYLVGAGRGRPVPNIAVTMLGIVYVGLLGSYASLILRGGPWPGSGTTVDQGIPLMILVVLGTELYDAGGYLLGSRLGRTPLSAASPSKTREGLVLGMACAVAAIVLLGGVLHVGVRTMGEALVLAGVVAVVAPFGDLFESMLKRDLGVKDMGDLIPSHGGLLDRVDALLLTLPASYYTLRILGLV